MSDKFVGYANSFQAIARLELESIRLLLDYLGHPEKELKFIHIAGTNGKGSVAAFLQSIFSCAGIKTGKYISPNMVSVCERISIDGEDISEEELFKTLKAVEKASEKVTEKLGSPPTQFEIWTAVAFCYFKEKKCELVILETGLGGARDATNVIEPPLASVITRIAFDHMGYLGNTLAEIAAQKAGIIKEHAGGAEGAVFTCRQDGEAAEVLKEECEKKKNKLFVSENFEVHEPVGMHEVISYRGLGSLEIGLAGQHQIENACIAIDAALYFGIEEKYIRHGLRLAKNIGRFEMISKNPQTIFDGAHNPNGMQGLVCGLKRYFSNMKPCFVMGFMADKDISKSAEIIKKEYPDLKIFTVRVEENPRAAKANELAEKLNACGLDAAPCADIKAALDAAKNAGDFVVVCGSLYLYKDLADKGCISESSHFFITHI